MLPFILVRAQLSLTNDGVPVLLQSADDSVSCGLPEDRRMVI